MHHDRSYVDSQVKRNKGFPDLVSFPEEFTLHATQEEKSGPARAHPRKDSKAESLRKTCETFVHTPLRDSELHQTCHVLYGERPLATGER